MKQTRLYLYPSNTTKIVHIITLGDKKTQVNDIRHAEKFVEWLTSETEDDNG